MKIGSYHTARGRLIGRAAAVFLALFFLAALVVPSIKTPAESDAEASENRKTAEKDPEGAVIGSTYHIDAPGTARSLPVQREDLGCGAIECMDSARSAVLIEATSGQMLLSSNPDEQLPMASTTKTMTALVVLEHCSPDEVLVVPDEAVGVEGSSLYLAYGERLTVRDLLYGLMLRSGNDCAVALAIHAAGSVEAFAELMNERAARMGLIHTHFVTPNGLHDKEHYTTAYELALIGAEALRNEEFRTIVSTKYYDFYSNIRHITVKNKNSMLWDYDGCIGIKTGYTSQAGRCLLFAAEKDGMLLVGCVLHCTPMFSVAPLMLNYGFQNFALASAVNKGDELARCEVTGGGEIPLVADRDILIPVRKGEAVDAEVRTELIADGYKPILEGEPIGVARVFVGNTPVGEAVLLAGESASVFSFRHYFDLLLGAFGRG